MRESIRLLVRRLGMRESIRLLHPHFFMAFKYCLSLLCSSAEASCITTGDHMSYHMHATAFY